MTGHETAGASKADARKHRVIEAARHLFVRQGFHQTGMAQIAETSGVKVGQIYRDFASKEDLISAICAQDVANLLNNSGVFGQVSRERGDVLADWIDAYVAEQPTLDQCRIFAEIGAEASRNSRIAEVVQELEKRVKPNLAHVLDELAPEAIPLSARDQYVELMHLITVGTIVQRSIDPAFDPKPATLKLMKLIEGDLEALPTSP
jgi:AcrR family transcriptional regulator